MNTIGERIKALRKSRNLSTNGLEDQLGASRGLVSRWEKNISPPGAKFLILLSDFFGVSTDWILKGDEGETKKGRKVKPFFLEKNSNLITKIARLNEKELNLISDLVDSISQKPHYRFLPFVHLPVGEEKATPYSGRENGEQGIRFPGLVMEAPAGPYHHRESAAQKEEREPETQQETERLFVVQATDNSMAGKGIRAGDYAIIRWQERLTEGEIGLFQVGDVYTIRIFSQEQDKIVLKAAAEGISDQVYEKASPAFSILGKVTDAIAHEQMSAWMPFAFDQPPQA